MIILNVRGLLAGNRNTRWFVQQSELERELLVARRVWQFSLEP